MKDFYNILGVIRTAEDIVIKAAYRALAQRYHPDKFTESSAEAQRRMQELNEAYETLSDPEKRSAYDSYLASLVNQDGIESDEIESEFDELEKIWSEIIEFFPDLTDICENLAKISKSLVRTYKYYLIESKSFENRKQIAENIEKSFLNNYFGENEKIVQFGKYLVLCKLKHAAKKLNRAVYLIGSNVDPDVIIGKIFSLDLGENEKVLLKLLERRNSLIPASAIKKVLESENMDPFDLRNFIREFRGELVWHENPPTKFKVCAGDYRSDYMIISDVLGLGKKLASIVKDALNNSASGEQ